MWNKTHATAKGSASPGAAITRMAALLASRPPLPPYHPHPDTVITVIASVKKNTAANNAARFNQTLSWPNLPWTLGNFYPSRKCSIVEPKQCGNAHLHWQPFSRRQAAERKRHGSLTAGSGRPAGRQPIRSVHANQSPAYRRRPHY